MYLKSLLSKDMAKPLPLQTFGKTGGLVHLNFSSYVPEHQNAGQENWLLSDSVASDEIVCKRLQLGSF